MSHHLQPIFKIANEKVLTSTEHFRSGFTSRDIPAHALSSPHAGGEIISNEYTPPLWSNYSFQTLRDDQQLSPSSTTSMTFSRPSVNLSRLDIATSSRHGSEPSSTPSSSATTYSFTLRYSPDTQMDDGEADVAPKIEELDDDVMTDTKVSPSSESPQTTTAGANGLPGTKRRGRPRKHPLPEKNLTRGPNGRSKTGCITCRKRKKKCDETKPSCKHHLAHTSPMIPHIFCALVFKSKYFCCRFNVP